jgi:3-oxoacyl-(acyl-carrier-protein) synthase
MQRAPGKRLEQLVWLRRRQRNADFQQEPVNRVFIRGIGAVSPAGWDAASLRQALERGLPIAAGPLERPGWKQPLRVRRVPQPMPKLPFLGHARLRRTSPVSLYAAAAGMEALRNGGYAPKEAHRLGVIFCITAGCVQYSRRFYDEALRNPATASPVIFPETVFNAPGSHLGAILESAAINYTLVGDPGTFLQGIALAAGWLSEGKADSCLVVGAEEIDWLMADAYRHFSRGVVCGEGAGAVYFSNESPAGASGVELLAITSPGLYLNGMSRLQAIRRMRAELPCAGPGAMLCDSMAGWPARDRAESDVWSDWNGSRLSPKRVLGEGLMAAGAWQCVAAVDHLRSDGHRTALVSIAGSHQQAIGACFSTYQNG